MSLEVKPLAGRARWAVIALAAVIVTDVLAIVSDWLEIRLMNRLVNGEDVSLDSLDSDDTRQLVVVALTFVVYVVSIVFFLRWFHRAHANLPALQSTPRFKPWWAIVGWFIPIMWLWRPKQVANDVWRGSDPSARSLHISKSDVPPLLNLWWAAWLIAGFVYTRASLAYFSAPLATDAGLAAMLGFTDDAEAVRRAAIYDLVASCVDIVAGVLAILVVRSLTTRQLERQEMLAALPEQSATPSTTVE